MATKILSFSLKIDGVKSQLSDLNALEKQLAEIKKKIKDINDVGMSKITDEESKLTVAINNTKKAIEDRNKAIKKDMSDAAQQARERKAWEQGNRDLLRQEREEIRRVAAQRKLDVQEAIRNDEIKKKSIIGLRHVLNDLRSEYDKLSEAERNAARGIELRDRIQQQHQNLLGLESATGRSQRNVGNYPTVGNVANTFISNASGGLLGGGMSAFALGGVAAAGVAATSLMKQIISLNAEIDGIQANVRKTTGLNSAAVERLTDGLKALDTSTTLQDLLKISIEAGRFGVTGEEGVLKFTEAVNVLNIALGDEFSGGVEETTNTVAKLSNILFGATSDGTELAQNFQFIGNALNELANNGAASAGEIADVATRIGGVGKAIGLTQGDILGVSSAIIEMGINAERGGTAFVRLNQNMRENLDKFAKSTGIAKEELHKLLDTNPIAAINLVISKLVDKSGGSATELVKLLGELGLKGHGVSEIFFKWADNQELVNDRIKTGNIAIGETNSLLNEQREMMDNIPGQWQRLKNAMSDFAVNSGLQNFTKNFLKDSADAFQAWSQWAQGNLTFKEALKYSGGNRDGREERIKIASRQGIRDAEKARGNRTYYDANGRPYKLTVNGREYVKQEIKGNPDDGGATPPKGQGNKKSAPDYRIGSIKDLEKRYNDLVSKLQTEVDPKVLTIIIEKSNEAKKKLDDAKEALELLQNRIATRERKTPGQLPQLPIRDAVDEIGEVVSEKGEKKVFDFLDKYKQKNLKDISDIEKARDKAREERLAKEIEYQEKIKAASFDYANIIADGIFDLEQIARENETKNALNAIDKEYNYKLEQAKGNATIEAALEKEKSDKIEKIQREAFEQDKQAKIAQAIVSGALAIIQALATLGPIGGAIAAIGIGATTGFQIAKIKAATFADGGYTGEGIMPADSTGFKPAGIVHEGEFVFTKEKTQKYRPFFEALHRSKYADGGVVSAMPQSINTGNPMVARVNNTDMITFARIVAQETRIAVMDGVLAGEEQKTRLIERRNIQQYNSTR
jgi:TP901 family phage tail tape measure protein